MRRIYVGVFQFPSSLTDDVCERVPLDVRGVVMLQFNFMHIDTQSKKSKIQSVTHVFVFFSEGKSMIRPAIEKLCC